MGLRVIGRDGDRIAVGGQRTIGVTEALARETEIELCLEVVGRDRNHSLEGGLRLAEPTLALAHHTKREAGVGEVGLGGEGAGQEVGGAVGIPARFADHAKVEQAHWMVGLDLENARVNPRRLAEAPRLLMLDGKPEQLLRCHAAASPEPRNSTATSGQHD